MDTSNWRSNQGGSKGGESSMESVGWRTQFPSDARQKIVNKLIDLLKKQLPPGQEKLHELRNIALMLEEKIFTTATSHSDYVHKISIKLMTLEKRSNSNSLQSNSAVNPSDSGSQGMQQVNTQSQPISIPVQSSHPQSGKQILPQSIQNNIAVQNSSFQNVPNISGIQQNSVGNNMTHGILPNNFVSQRQIPGSQQQSQNLQNHLYQQQLAQIAKQNLHQNNNTVSVQSHIHQKLLQSQQSVMQPTMLPQYQQNQGQPLSQHHQQSVLRQQMPHQQQNLRLVGHQNNISNVQQLQQNSVVHHNNFSGLHQNHLNMKPLSNLSQQMQQRIPTSGGFQQQNVANQQKQLLQQQRVMPEVSSTSSDSTAQTGNTNSGNWQEEVYQKMKAMKDKYMPVLKDMYQKCIIKLQQNDSLPQQPNNEQLEKLKKLKHMLECCITFLQVPKTNISLNHKEKLGEYERQIVNFITTHKRKPQIQLVNSQQNNNMQQNSNMIQQQQQQQLKQIQQREMQQQFLHKQKQLLNQNHHQLHSQTKQQKQQNENEINNSKTEQQQNVVNSVTKSANSPLQSPTVNSGVSSLSNNGNNNKPNSGMVNSQTVSIGTPGISPSPLLSEFTSPDGKSVSVISGKSTGTEEEPMEHLLKVVKSISQKSLSASVSEIGSVVSMIDSIAESAPGNGSKAAIGEDLITMTKYRIKKTAKRKSNFYNVVSSVNHSFNCFETSELESTATSTIKKARTEITDPVLEEIREINKGVINTVVDIISHEDFTLSEVGKGTVVKCSFKAAAFAPNLKSQYDSMQMSPIQPLRLLIPANYPNCSPILLDDIPVEVSREHEDISIKVKGRFSSCLRKLSEPMSLDEMVKTWDVCARAVILEHVKQNGGGGTFTSKYGAWEDCVIAA